MRFVNNNRRARNSFLRSRQGRINATSERVAGFVLGTPMETPFESKPVDMEQANRIGGPLRPPAYWGAKFGGQTGGGE